MQQLEATPQEPNRFPNCVSMKLHSVPVQAEAILVELIRGQVAATSDQVDLKLTIRFGEQGIKVPGGTVWFGVRRGELKLKLTNAQLPLEKMKLTGEFEPVLEAEEQQERGREVEGHAALAGGVKVKEGSKTSDKVKRKVYQVYGGGTETEPTWTFETKTTEPFLRGQLTQADLGTVEVAASPCGAEMTFEVCKQDIQLTRAEGVLPKDIGRNKRALLERAFCLRYIAPKLQPHLSRVEVEL